MRALADRPDLDVLIFGDRGVLTRAATVMNVAIPTNVVEVTALTESQARPGQPSELSGRAQVDYLAAATTAILKDEIAALVTAPLSKEWAGKAGFTFPGHTEYLAARAGVTDFAMMLAGPTLKVTVVTRHIALKDVPTQLSVPAIAAAIVLTTRAMRDGFGLALPRIAVAGLNPHAGEAGRFGDEEARLVVPAVTVARAQLAAAGIGAQVSGPHVPDSIFRQAALGQFDAVVALYHDQGLIPIKLLHFDDAVNLTLGLPFVRTSPDHGTAYDLAGTGRAQPDSFGAALDLAADLAKRKTGRAARIDAAELD